MANRFLNNITINDEYTLPSADGTADQIITTDGAGQLSFVDQSTINAGNAEHVVIYAKNTSGASISKGTPVYITGTVGATDTVQIAPADASDSAKMPAVGLLDDTLANNAFGYVITGGFMDNITTDPIDGSTPSSNDTVYVKSGGGLTLTKPTGSNLIQNVAKVGKVSGGSSGSLIVSSILRTNDVPNLTTGKIWVGSAANTIESATVHLDEANGRMGINTDSPDEDLEIKSATIPGIRLNSTDTSFPTFGTIQAFNNTTYRGGLTWASNPVQNGARITYIGFPSGSQKTGTFEVGANFVDTTINDGSMVTRLDTTGLGIGTTSPNRLLTVQTTSTGSYIAMNSSTGNTTIGSDVNGGFIVYDDTNSSYRMVINRLTGNVGIGTTNPQANLQVGSVTSSVYNLSVGKVDIVDTNKDLSDTQMGTLNLTSTTRTASSPFNQGYGPSITFTQNGSGYVDGYEKVIGGIKTEIKNATNLNYASIMQFYTHNNSSLSPRMTIDGSSGNVGIGVTSPSSKLHVESSDETVARFERNSGSGYTVLDIKDGVGTTGNSTIRFSDTDGSPGEINYEHADNSLRINTNSSEKLRINSSGNVGIGTTSPAEKLDINGNINIRNTAGGVRGIKRSDDGYNLHLAGGSSLTTGSYIEVNGGSRGGVGNALNGEINLVSGGSYQSSQSAVVGNYNFKTQWNGGSATLMHIDSSSGNVGIGTTSPSHELVVQGASSPNIELKNSNYSNGGFVLNRTNYGHQWKWWAESSVMYFGFSTDESNYANKFTIKSNGSVGIGTTSPSYKLDIAGDLRVDNGNIGSTSGDELTHARLQGARHFIDFKEVRTANDWDWKNTTFKIQTGVDATKHQSIDFVSDGSYHEHIDILTGNQVFNTRFTYDGKVGIGTTSPSTKLHALGTSSSMPSLGAAPTAAHFGGSSYGTLFSTLLSGRGVIQQGRVDGTATSYDLLFQPVGGNVGIGTTSSSEKLEVNGNVKAENYINQRVAWNSGFLHSSNNSANYYFVPIGYVVETTSNTYYNNWIAQYAGRVRKIVLRNIGSGTTPTATTVNFRVSVNGSVVYTGSTITVTGSGLDILASETLSDTDAVFNATDRIQVAYRTNGLWQNVAAGITLEYTE